MNESIHKFEQSGFENGRVIGRLRPTGVRPKFMDKIEQSGFESAIGRRVVLTGGTSQLSGMKQLAEVVLDKSVRLARPVGVHGLTDLSGTPQFATAIGLLLYGGKQAAQSSRVRQKEFNPLAWFTNIGRVLKLGTQ